MSNSFGNTSGTMGTWPVFMTAISTILGAILFLRFGYAVANVGLLGALGIIVIGHLVTLPTAMAVAEIATNQKVEGGGAYYMISRSFGLNIGAAIGIALFLSQAISVAFYVIAFAESFEPVLEWFNKTHASAYGIDLTMAEGKRIIGIVFMVLLALLMLTKGANIGVKALYLVVVVLLASLVMFFAGDVHSVQTHGIGDTVRNPDGFFHVFTIIFPAFTGIAAGLGLSGDLRDPKTAIPRGTLWATAVGIVVYVAVALKLYNSADLYDLNDQMVMARVAIWAPAIPIGLGCAAISSALGSVMIAPRTLQALGVDKIFPIRASKWFAAGTKKTKEPFNSAVVTCVIAFLFVVVGDIDFVAEIISMFFMVTYGAICTISFLEHFAADPSYRPTFKTHWAISLLGGVLCFVLMFLMNAPYALMSIAIMVGIYFWASHQSKDRQGGIANVFKGVIFKVNRELQLLLQKREVDVVEEEAWRPFAICVSKDTFKRQSAIDMITWLSQKYGYGTYIHFIEGFLSEETYQQSKDVKRRLVHFLEGTKSKVSLDTIISPSYTSAIAQVIQLSGVSGKGNNMILFEFQDDDVTGLGDVVNNYQLLKATEFDVCLLRTTYKGFGHHREIHVWISSHDYENSNLMILLAYIMLGHADWKGAIIKIFSIYTEGEIEEKKQRLKELISAGRLPISQHNIELVPQKSDVEIKSIVNSKSGEADLTIVGYNDAHLLEDTGGMFSGYDDLGNILFVSAFKEKEINML